MLIQKLLHAASFATGAILFVIYGGKQIDAMSGGDYFMMFLGICLMALSFVSLIILKLQSAPKDSP